MIDLKNANPTVFDFLFNIRIMIFVFWHKNFKKSANAFLIHGQKLLCPSDLSEYKDYLELISFCTVEIQNILFEDVQNIDEMMLCGIKTIFEAVRTPNKEVNTERMIIIRPSLFKPV